MEMKRQRSSCFSQFIACFKRNLIIMKRTKWKTLLEVILPIYFAFFSSTLSGGNLPAVDDPIKLSRLSDSPPTNWLVSPNTTEVRQIIGNVTRTVDQLNWPEPVITYFDKERDLEAYAADQEHSPSTAGIVFRAIAKEKVIYKIRMFSSLVNTKGLYDDLGNCRPTGNTWKCSPKWYTSSGFTSLQRVLDSTLIKFGHSGPPTVLPTYDLYAYPKDSYIDRTSAKLLLVPLYLLLGLVTLLSNFTSTLVVEKEKKIKAAMSIMGLRLSAYWLSWVTIYVIKVLIISAVVTIMLDKTGVIATNTSVTVFVLLLLYGTSLISLSILMSPFFNSEKVAGGFATFASMILGLFYFLIPYISGTVPAFVFYLVGLASPSAFTSGITSILTHDPAKGHQHGMDPTAAIIMLCVDNVLYMLLGFYFDHVIPNKDGQRYSLLFFLDPKFWSCCAKDSGARSSLNSPSVQESVNSDVEEIEENMRPHNAIKVRNLTKKYEKNQSITALDKVNFDIYENHITAILGHNGAGKTTFIQTLTGILKPTEGSIHVYGKDVTKPVNLSAFRDQLGVCLQEDILVDELNSREHLSFFADMKSVPASIKERRIKDLLKQTGLDDVESTPCKLLSGGQKRKLCVCIALIGDPKIVILDEPNSGVDPLSRRHMWTLLKSYRENRVIVITTHSMDEADILADRKIILSKGSVRCAGTSLFLKNRFGAGYHLNVNLVTDTDRTTIKEMVSSIVPEAKFERFTGTDASFLLPNNAVDKFPALFSAIEKSMASTNPQYVKSYGVSQTTLEEVFLKLGTEEENGLANTKAPRIHRTLSRTASANIASLNLCASFWKSMTAFLKVRFLLVLTQPTAVAPLVIFPLMFLGASYFFLNDKQEPSYSEPPIAINSSLYPARFQNILLHSDKQLPGLEKALKEFAVSPISVPNFKNRTFLQKSFMGVKVVEFGVNQTVWSWYVNDTFRHSLPILQNLMANVYWKALNALDTPVIHAINHPLPSPQSPKTFDGSVYGFILLSPLFWCYIPSLLAIDAVEDREFRHRQALRISGLSWISYWMATLISHGTIFIAICMLMLFVQRFIFGLVFLQNNLVVLAIVILLLLYTPAAFLCSYFVLHMFNKKESARNFFPLLSYLIPIVLSTALGVSTMFDIKTASTLHLVFSFLWPFYVPQGVFYWLLTGEEDPFNYRIRITFYALMLHSVLFSLLLPIADVLKFGGNIGDLFRKTSKRVVNSDRYYPEEDEDVQTEKKRVNTYINVRRNSVAVTPTLLFQGVRKEFNARRCLRRGSSKLAVRSLSLFVEPEEVFGLLGPNGAGKTTAIKVTVADEKATEGRVLVGGREVVNTMSGALDIIGYCPQHDALWNSLTVRQHLHAYAAIRGITGHQVRSTCDNIMKNLHIFEYADTKVKKLSGGTKRKVMYAIAILSKPRLLLLDEPSTGLDPQAKRHLWSTIGAAVHDGNGGSVVLTTHSMEEANALCNRIGIMVNGLLRCVGSIQHLKDKYGAGYYLELKWNPVNSSLNKIQEIVRQICPQATQNELYENHAVYNVPQSSLTSIALVFEYLQKQKEENHLEEFTFSQKTIEQVFLRLAKEQEEDI